MPWKCSRAGALNSLHSPPRAASGLWVFLCALFMLLSIASVAHAAMESIIVMVTLNGQAEGDRFVMVDDGGVFYVATADLAAMGITLPDMSGLVNGTVVELGGQPHVRIANVPGMEYEFDEGSATLRLNVSPSMLPTATRELGQGGHQKVMIPTGTTGYLNYAAAYTGGTAYADPYVEGTLELGVRRGDVFFRSDAITRSGIQTDEGFHRLDTALSWESRAGHWRAVAGDFTSASGPFSGGVRMAGVAYTRDFEMDPYFIEYPRMNLSGLLSLPSEVEVYVNGVRVFDESFGPGGYEIGNLSYYSGYNDVRVVVRDSMGREQVVELPYYFSEHLLKKGLHSFGYYAGAMRHDYSLDTDGYEDSAFVGFHRYGFTDNITAGLRAAVSSAMTEAGAEAVVRVGPFGVAEAAAATSQVKEAGTSDVAATGRFTLSRGPLSVRLSASGYTGSYTSFGTTSPGENRIVATGGVSYHFKGVGSIGLAHTEVVKHWDEHVATTAGTWSRPLGRRTTMLMRVSQTDTDTADETMAFVGLSRRIGESHSARLTLEDSDTVTRVYTSIENEAPVGEGFGYRAALRKEEFETESVDTGEAYVQWNARYAILSADVNSASGALGGDAERYTLRMAGSVYAMEGGGVGVSRPVGQGFALVKLGEIEGVRVGAGGRPMGRTSAVGTLFVPTLQSYLPNRVTVDSSDIPMDYALERMSMDISPSEGGGGVLDFKPLRLQAFTGIFVYEGSGGDMPLDYTEGTLKGWETDVIVPTGTGGEFYFENVPPGVYAVYIRFKGSLYRATVSVPESPEPLVDFGRVTVELLQDDALMDERPTALPPVEVAPLEAAPVEVAPAEAAPAEVAPVEVAPAEELIE